MQIIQVENYEEISKITAEEVKKQILHKPDSVLGLVTGGTTEGLYNSLAEMFCKGEIDFSKVKTINTDEYYKIDSDNTQSYSYFMNMRFFSKVNISPKCINFINGMADDSQKECEIYDEKIKKTGGIDLLILGMGNNGHIAFNEPSKDGFVMPTHVEELSLETIVANSRFFSQGQNTPRKAITIGVGAIMQSKRILLLVSGKGKNVTLNKAIYGPVTSLLPASILQLHHDVTVIADKDALQ